LGFDLAKRPSLATTLITDIYTGLVVEMDNMRPDTVLYHMQWIEYPDNHPN